MRKSTVIYRSTDDINNFKIRVRITEENQEGLAGNVEEDESKTFSWQQKVYGKFERDFYKDEKNCITDLEKKYHEDIIKLVHSDNIIFSYVNEDDFCLTEENCVLNSKITTELYKQVTNVQHNNEDINVFKETDGFNLKQSFINSLQNPYGIHRNYEIMYIMADLGNYVNKTWLKAEYILCIIKYEYTQNFLQIFPEFTRTEPYYIQADNDNKRTFCYYIEDVSEKMPIDVLLKENEILNKITLHQSKMRLQKTGTDFELPPKNKLNVHLFFEILSARNFEHNDIYVQYFIELPENWFCKDPLTLRGTTQTSHSSKDDNLSYFGYPFEVCLEYNIKEFGKSSILRAPCIYFEVVSKDSWDRFRTEGLTYKMLPVSQSGKYEYNLQSLRICSGGIVGNLRRFFVGDFASYDDLTWIAHPKDYDKTVLNKYGVDTVGTGQINIRLNVVHQCQAFMADFKEGTSRKHEKFILEKLNTSSLVKSIEQVLEAFKVAKRKMIEARKNV